MSQNRVRHNRGTLSAPEQQEKGPARDAPTVDLREREGAASWNHSTPLPLRSIFAPSEATSLTSSDGLPHGTIPTWPQRPNGKEVRPASFYSERYLDAFPVLLRGLEPSEYFSPFEWLQSEYEHQALAMYADMCGFIRYTSADWRAKTLATVTVLPLMDDVAAFMV